MAARYILIPPIYIHTYIHISRDSRRVLRSSSLSSTSFSGCHESRRSATSSTSLVTVSPPLVIFSLSSLFIYIFLFTLRVPLPAHAGSFLFHLFPLLFSNFPAFFPPFLRTAYTHTHTHTCTYTCTSYIQVSHIHTVPSGCSFKSFYPTAILSTILRFTERSSSSFVLLFRNLVALLLCFYPFHPIFSIRTRVRSSPSSP